MTPEGGYRTLGGRGTAVYSEKKSDFLGYAAPCETEEEALAILSGIRKKHGDARHIAYAYVLRDRHTARFSDDGEPSGTAGAPILEFLKKTGIEDAILCVVRYFGGILLGTGGLTRAYGKAAKDAAEAAGIAVLVPFTVFSVSCSYGDYQKLTRLVPLFGVREEQTVYETGVTVSGSLPSEKRDAFAAAVTEATSGGVSVLFSGERFDRVPESI